MSERPESDVSYIDIAPTSMIQVSRTDFISPTLTTIVSDFGGAMGIWLGMGVSGLHHSDRGEATRDYDRPPPWIDNSVRKIFNSFV